MLTFEEYTALADHRTELVKLVNHNYQKPWAYKNRVGHLTETIHNTTWAKYLEAMTIPYAESIDRRYKMLWDESNRFYIITPTGDIHQYFGCSAPIALERHILDDWDFYQ